MIELRLRIVGTDEMIRRGSGIGYVNVMVVRSVDNDTVDGAMSPAVLECRENDNVTGGAGGQIGAWCEVPIEDVAGAGAAPGTKLPEGKAS